jgi:tripartite-type tricarboxylate transporter receptor subunit TctC
MSKIEQKSSLISRRALCTGLALAPAATAFLSLTDLASAQGKYPERPVRIIVPFAAGGIADITTRLIGEKMGDKLGQRFVIENVPGPGGIAAARAAMAAGPDGHTLILVTNGTAISVPLFKSLPFDPFKDFTPISGMGNFDCVFVVNAESKYKTLGDVLKEAKANPGKLNVGTIAVGSTQHLSAEFFKSAAQLNFLIVPFRTTPDATVGLLRNDVDLVIDFPAALQAGLSDKKLRPIAATGPVSAEMLGVPTVAQAGVPSYEVTSWNSMWAPAGTPKEILAVLHKTLQEVLADPEVKRRALELGIAALGSTPEAAEARMRADIEKWRKVIEVANIERK